MTKLLLNIIIIALSGLSAYISYTKLTDIYTLCGFFFSGLLFGIFIMNLKLNVKNDKINSYQRQLEKESISSNESSSRVKVLESKIEVLEKALENALNNK